MLHVVEPLTFIFLHLLVVDVFAETMRLVVDELTFVVVTVCMPKFSFSVGFSVTDITGIGGAIGPLKDTLAVRDEDHILGATAVFSLEDFHLTGVVRPVRMDLEVFFFD